MERKKENYCKLVLKAALSCTGDKKTDKEYKGPEIGTETLCLHTYLTQ